VGAESTKASLKWYLPPPRTGNRSEVSKVSGLFQSRVLYIH